MDAAELGASRSGEDRAFLPPAPPVDRASRLIALALVACGFAGLAAYVLQHEPALPPRTQLSPALPPPPPRVTPRESREQVGTPLRILVAIKCTDAQARASYIGPGDGCPAGSERFEVWADPRENLVRGMTPEERKVALRSAPQIAPPAPASPAAPPAPADNRAQCAMFDQLIAGYDQQARQRLSAAQQDYIKEARRKARDEQYRLHC